MTRVRTTPAHTIPPTSTMAAGEIAEYVYDASTDLGEGQTPENPTVELRNADTRAEIEGGATLDTPPIAGNALAIRVAQIERGVTYELRIAFDHSSPRVVGEHTVKIHVIEGV